MVRKPATIVATVDPVDALPTVTISGAVPALVSEAVEGYRWTNRMSRADVVKQALTEWCETRELLEDARARLTEQLSEPVEVTE